MAMHREGRPAAGAYALGDQERKQERLARMIPQLVLVVRGRTPAATLPLTRRPPVPPEESGIGVREKDVLFARARELADSERLWTVTEPASAGSSG